jgi:hypothetical protein
MPALHQPPAKPSELQVFIRHFEGALEARFDLAADMPMRPADALKAVLDSVVEARKEMGW